jgi:hypothetical protein
VFYSYRSRGISSKDSEGDTTRGRIGRDTPAATSQISKVRWVRAKIRIRRRRDRRRDLGLLMSCPGRLIIYYSTSIRLCSAQNLLKTQQALQTEGELNITTGGLRYKLPIRPKDSINRKISSNGEGRGRWLA